MTDTTTTKQEAQALFDRAFLGVIQQGGPSIKWGYACCYRAEDGKKCAVGHLIADEEYNPAFEGMGVHILKRKGLLPTRLAKHLDLLICMQQAHDKASVIYRGAGFLSGFLDGFRRRMELIAKEHGLVIPSVNPQENPK